MLPITSLLILLVTVTSSMRRPCSLQDRSGLGVCRSSCSIKGQGVVGRLSKSVRTFKCGPGKVCCPQEGLKNKKRRVNKADKCGNKRGTPWLVKIRYSTRNICSGTLVSPTKVITAAMCVNAGLPLVVVGEVVMDTVKVVLHPDFDLETMANNMAVVELEQPVVGVLPACLGGGLGGSLQEVGWGNFEMRDQSVLVRRGMERVGKGECRDMLDSTGIDFINFDLNSSSLVCLRTESEQCAGDLGGPLLSTNHKTGSVEVVGVRTVPLMCGPLLGMEDFPGIFTRLGPFLAWLGGQLV